MEKLIGSESYPGSMWEYGNMSPKDGQRGASLPLKEVGQEAQTKTEEGGERRNSDRIEEHRACHEVPNIQISCCSSSMLI